MFVSFVMALSRLLKESRCNRARNKPEALRWEEERAAWGPSGSVSFVLLDPPAADRFFFCAAEKPRGARFLRPDGPAAQQVRRV